MKYGAEEGLGGAFGRFVPVRDPSDPHDWGILNTKITGASARPAVAKLDHAGCVRACARVGCCVMLHIRFD